MPGMSHSRTSKIAPGLLVLSLVVLLAIGAAVVFLSAPKSPQARYTLDRATTHVTGPVGQDGYVDYVTALNQRLSQGIKPAENANVLIWQMFGPHPEGGAGMPAGYFHWLGMTRPPEQGDYWKPRRRFLQEHPELVPGARRGQPTDAAQVDQQLELATHGPWSRKHFPWIAAWLQANARPLDLAIQASRRPEYYNPLVPGGSATFASLLEALLPNVQMCREVAQALVCRAMLELDQGRTEDASRDLLATHRLSRLVARGGSLVELLVGIAIDTYFNRADLAVLTDSRLDRKSILAKLNDLEHLPPFPSVADKVDLTERFLFLDSMMMIMRHGAAYLETMSSQRPASRPASFFERIQDAWLNWHLEHVNWDLVLRSGNSLVRPDVGCDAHPRSPRARSGVGRDRRRSERPPQGCGSADSAG